MIYVSPTYDTLKNARRDTIANVYHKLKCYRKSAIEKRIVIIKESEPITTDLITINSSVLEAELYVNILTCLNRGLDQKIAELFPTHDDAFIFESLPGAGAALAPRIMCALGCNRKHFNNASEIQSYSGVAPVRISSGTSFVVKWRYGCSKYLRQTFIEFAKASLGSSMWAAAYYHMQIARGKSHQAAVRALAFKWIRIIFRCWQKKERYDEMKYLQSLQKNKAPLLEYFGYKQVKSPI